VGAFQLIPRDVEDLCEKSSVKVVGESGFVRSFAPKPF
jgi:hypothetical protein